MEVEENKRKRLEKEEKGARMAKGKRDSELDANRLKAEQKDKRREVERKKRKQVVEERIVKFKKMMMNTLENGKAEKNGQLEWETPNLDRTMLRTLSLIPEFEE